MLGTSAEGGFSLWNSHRLSSRIEEVSLCSNKDLIAVRIDTKRLVILRPDSCVKKFEIPQGSVALSWAQDGRFISVGLETGEIVLYESETGQKVYHFICPLFRDAGMLKQMIWLNNIHEVVCRQPAEDRGEYERLRSLKEVASASELLEKLGLGWSDQSNEMETDLDDLVVDFGKAIFTGNELCRFLDLSSTQDDNDELRYGGILQNSKTIDGLLGINVGLWDDGSARACTGFFSCTRFYFPEYEKCKRHLTLLAEPDNCRDNLNFLAFFENGATTLYNYTFNSIAPPPVLRTLESISRKIFTAMAVISNEICSIERIYNAISKSISSKKEAYNAISEDMGITGCFVTNLLFFLVTGKGINEACEQFLIKEVSNIKSFHKWYNSLKQNLENIRLNIYRRCLPLLQNLLMCVLDIKSLLKCQPLMNIKLNLDPEILEVTQNNIHTLIVTLGHLEEDSAIVQRCLKSFVNWLLKESMDLESDNIHNDALDMGYEDFSVPDAVLFMYTFFYEKCEGESGDVIKSLKTLISSNSSIFLVSWDKYFNENKQRAPLEYISETTWVDRVYENSSAPKSIWALFSDIENMLLNSLRAMASSVEKVVSPHFAIRLLYPQPTEISTNISLDFTYCNYMSTFDVGDAFIQAKVSTLFEDIPAIGVIIRLLERSKIRNYLNNGIQDGPVNTLDLKLLLPNEPSITADIKSRGRCSTYTHIIDFLLYNESTILILCSQSLSSGE